jgi:hypothetical protein
MYDPDPCALIIFLIFFFLSIKVDRIAASEEGTATAAGVATPEKMKGILVFYISVQYRT